MNYKAWPDEDLRRVLLTDPDDTSAICEAAERFSKATHEDSQLIECPECGHEWDCLE